MRIIILFENANYILTKNTNGKTLTLTFLFPEKKLEYKTVQLHVYKEKYIYACMMNNIYTQKRIFDMKMNLNNNYECNKS